MGNVEMALVQPEAVKDPSLAGDLTLQVEQAFHMPDAHVSVEISIRNSEQGVTEVHPDGTGENKNSHSPTYKEAAPVVLRKVNPEDVLIFALHTHPGKKFGLPGPKGKELGTTEWRVRDFVRRPVRAMVFNDKDANIVMEPKEGKPATLQVRVASDPFPAGWPAPQPQPTQTYPKHVMMITRGTRGDVQPFAALARGLAERLGWRITICTELRYKEYLQKVTADLPPGQIQFRPSGGDTSKKIESTVSKKAMNTSTHLMQALMLSRSEAEFFGSEGALFHWAETLKPDSLVYGFTMANIAMIISEALHIPIVGFILQPSVIPSESYTPVTPITEGMTFPGRKKIAEIRCSEGVQKNLKHMMEAPPLPGTGLHTMRKKHHLHDIPAGRTWKVLMEQKSPCVVPIHPVAFNGKPADWGDNVKLTEFIFLRDKSQQTLDAMYTDFIEKAKADGHPVVLMAFSSMPVSREEILTTAALIVEKCTPQPAVIAMMGSRPAEKIGADLEKRVEGFKARGLLLEGKAAPFGQLLPRMDCNIIHGGLGTTAESMRAGKPVLVTGILLMDQRFWAKQVTELGISPGCSHIDVFDKHCVEWVTQALDPDGEWARNARELAAKLGDSDGVRENVEAVAEFVNNPGPLMDLREPEGRMARVKSAGRNLTAKAKGVLVHPMQSLHRKGRESPPRPSGAEDKTP